MLANKTDPTPSPSVGLSENSVQDIVAGLSDLTPPTELTVLNQIAFILARNSMTMTTIKKLCSDPIKWEKASVAFGLNFGQNLLWELIGDELRSSSVP